MPEITRPSALTYGRMFAPISIGEMREDITFGITQLAEILGIPVPVLQDWDKCGLLRPARQATRGVKKLRRYTGQDAIAAVAIRTAKGLGFQHGELSEVSDTIRSSDLSILIACSWLCMRFEPIRTDEGLHTLRKTIAVVFDEEDRQAFVKAEVIPGGGALSFDLAELVAKRVEEAAASETLPLGFMADVLGRTTHQAEAV